MSTPNPDEALGMADEPEQMRGTDEGTANRPAEGGAPNPESGVGLGAGEPNTFEPEDDPEA